MGTKEDILDEHSSAGMMRKYGAESKCEIYERDEKQALRKFRTGSGREQPVYIVVFKTFVEFSVQSVAGYHSEEDIPAVFATYFLKRNANSRFLFWCVEEIGGDYYCFSCMHNADIRLIDTEYISEVTDILIKECDEFDEMYLGICRKLGKIK